MNLLDTVLLTQYKSGGEAIVVGLLQGLVLWGVVAFFRGAKKVVKGKDFEEIKGKSLENDSDKNNVK